MRLVAENLYLYLYYKELNFNSINEYAFSNTGEIYVL
jgi:hypothetical protein